MSFYQHGMSLKALLEKPELLQAPLKLDDGKDKEKDVDFDDLGGHMFASQSAFLGPQLWDKTVSYDEADIKLEFMDLDEFLSETYIVDDIPNDGNAECPPPDPAQLLREQELEQKQISARPVVVQEIPLEPRQPVAESSLLNQSQLRALLVGGTNEMSTSHDKVQELIVPGATNAHGLSPVHQPSPPQQCIVRPVDLDLDLSPRSASPQEELSPSQSPSTHQHSRDCKSPHMNESPGPDSEVVESDAEDFDPRRRSFTEEELRPQPLIKKSRKVFVPEDLKDDKYWVRRRKNNVAARRSRDARRTKENQIAMRALYLECKIKNLVDDLEISKIENSRLRARLAKYEPQLAARH